MSIKLKAPFNYQLTFSPHQTRTANHLQVSLPDLIPPATLIYVQSILRTRAETLVKLVGEEDLEISTEFGIWICTL